MNDAVRRVGEDWELRFERRYPHPPEKVWRTLTEREHLSAWYPFLAVEMDVRVGGIIRFRDEQGTEVHAEITELVPHRSFAFTEFDEATGAHRLRFRLTPDGGGCVLVMEHAFADNPWAERTQQGWLGCLDVLAATADRFALGGLETVGGRPVLRFERRLAHAPERVWRAITDPAETARWFPASIDTEPRAGAPMRFSFGDDADPGGRFAEGEVLEYDPPKVYAFRWARSVLRFELVPDGDGCVLSFSHTLSGTGTSGDRPSVARQGPGWERGLEVLAAGLDGRDAPERDGRWFLARAEQYVEEYGLADGELRTTGDGRVVRFERDLVQPPEEVWRVLTEGGVPVAGEPVPVRFTHGHLEPAEVTTVEPVCAVEYGVVPSGRVRVELRDQEPVGTRLVLTHTLDPAAEAETALAAWHTHLELLFAALHGDVRCPWPDARTAELRRRYAERLGTEAAATAGDDR
ncbi:SRPBCC domain-containing protein [Prauserella oleivorans]|uniref:SRPBCC domain-containing protein n=1 Tax=Prauserella oleivorans TaxID=1478153 RepID=A0ABW5WEU8_9PSEU